MASNQTKALSFTLLGLLWVSLAGGCSGGPSESSSPQVSSGEASGKCVIDVISKYEILGIPKYSDLIERDAPHRETLPGELPYKFAKGADARGWRFFLGPAESVALVNENKVWRLVLRKLEDLCINGEQVSDLGSATEDMESLGYSHQLGEAETASGSETINSFTSAYITLMLLTPPKDGMRVLVLDIQSYHDDEELRLLRSGKMSYDDLLESDSK